ncbi:MAG: NlpC/P60 family protein [Acidimicrobiia bacterium]
MAALFAATGSVAAAPAVWGVVIGAPGDINVSEGTPWPSGDLSAQPDPSPAKTPGDRTFAPDDAGGADVSSAALVETAAGGITVDAAGVVDAPGLHPLPPLRLVDTRTAQRIDSSTPLIVPVPVSDTVPDSATSVLVNLTAVDARSAGYLTLFPCGDVMPATSNVNFTSSRPVAGAATVGLGRQRSICVYASAPTHVIIDLNGWFGADGVGMTAMNPTRLLDTRTSGRTKDRVYRIEPGPFGVPAGATAVTVNVTVTVPADAGYATAYPCGANVPLASNLNYDKGATVANLATVALQDGSFCVTTSTNADVVVDLQAWFGPGAPARTVDGVATRRLLDTRSSTIVAAGTSVEVSIASSSAVMLTIVATEPKGAGYLTVYPCDQARPTTSNLNYAKGQTVANTALVNGLGSLVCVYSSATAHVVVDLNARYGDATSTPGALAVRWANTQLGSPYAAINPYRFGDSKYGARWDCPNGQLLCTRVDMHGIARTITAGSWAYDCSGFAVAAWLHAGVDLVRQNAAWTDPMYLNLPRVERANVQVGDLLLTVTTGSGDLTDHVGLYVDATHMVQAGACPNGSGVCVRGIDWSRVVAIVRPRY